ncbi:MAG: hypothetical protein WC791_04005 [Candidatus Paceibacterota bacterium]|jgi:hypothetical protein
MLNLLDTTEKKKIFTEYYFRIAVVSIFAIGALSVASLFLLIPPYIFSVSKYNNAQLNVSVLEVKYGNSEKEKEIAAQIRDINTKTELLLAGGASAQSSPLQSILNLLKIKGTFVKINAISYDLTSTPHRIVLSGIAPTRDGLAAFIEELKKEPTLSGVTLPISSYVKSTNISFSIVFNITSSASVVKPSKNTPSVSRPF